MKKYFSLVILFSFLLTLSFSQNKKENKEEPKDEKSAIFSGLKFRHIGPAFMSGRISDIAIHPDNQNTWYVTAGSGGVWKTNNAGNTWSSLFDGQKSYSMGCIALDPQNPEIVWAGTGENVGGRHVGYGDGIYKSEDGGSSWKNMGLERSEHISKVIVHPQDHKTVWVAAQGPLWSKGGERGLYKTTDGGETWTKTLGDNEWVGATDILMDPRDPDILYAATWQRHRTVAGYLGGGPGTAIYKSMDGGDNWEKLTNGLPTSNLGKIGLAISPQKPDVVYAAIELDRRTGAVFKSENQGASWQKMSDAVSGGTGPHYYQELYASPHNYGELYLVDNYMQISYDDGKTFVRMNEDEKHVDNHAIAFKSNDPNYILVGCDGGLYESFDKTKNWKFINNLPITQFYKIAVDDAEPFYYVYGGTQDNNTQGVPSRTDNVHGIRNSDWFVVLGGDGHQPATEPGNPNIVYAQWQQGNLTRHDRLSGENIYIKPQPELGEKTERYNWDAPVLVSPHNPTTIYHASYRVWKSEDRGDSWKAISGDLTKNIERIQTPFYGEKQKWDNPWDIYAMSDYSTITSLAESPIQEGLMYAGTDDGLIQVTEDGGANWRKVDFAKIPSLPTTAFVNDIKADLYDENIVYAVFDNHKYGDYNPYLFKSTDKGKTWSSISNNLPERTLLWRIVQDHEEKNLMFLGTEFGVYFSMDGAQTWIKLSNGLPNISVRDLCIQKRENDLIVGTFGRGIYILDDFSALRDFNLADEEIQAKLFTPRDGLWYIPRKILGWDKQGSQGDDYFVADNPPFGVEFTYYLQDSIPSLKALRLQEEKNIVESKGNVAVPSWEILEQERNELKPSIYLFIYDADGKIINRVKAKNNKGFNRVVWDLTTAAVFTLSAENINKDLKGYTIGPGEYSAELFKQIDGIYSSISDKKFFKVKAINKPGLQGGSSDDVVAHWKQIMEIRSESIDLSNELKKAENTLSLMLKAYEKAQVSNEETLKGLVETRDKIQELKILVMGSESREEVGEKEEYPTISNYIWAASSSGSTYGPTSEQIKSLQKASTLLSQSRLAIDSISDEILTLKTRLSDIKAPRIDE